MNGKITITVTISFIIVFSALFVSDNSSSTESETKSNHEFFSQDFSKDEKKILILGSSHIGTLNTTLVNDIVNKKKSDFEVYHLGYNGDKPQIREEMLSSILSIEPSYIFYGISYRDFGSFNVNAEPEFYDIKQHWELTVEEFNEKESINPQLMVRKAIREFLVITGFTQETSYDIVPINTPFARMSEIQTEILNRDELQRLVLNSPSSPSTLTIQSEDNQETKALKRIINQLQEQDITIVFFTTPLSKEYIENLPDSTKKEFELILNDIENNYSVKIYEFTEKYSELNVWNDLDHVAYNEKSMMYSEDLGEIIILEIDA